MVLRLQTAIHLPAGSSGAYTIEEKKNDSWLRVKCFRQAVDTKLSSVSCPHVVSTKHGTEGEKGGGRREGEREGGGQRERRGEREREREGG